MKYIKTYNKIFELAANNIHIRQFVSELGIAPLYHAIKSENAILALKEDKLGGYSIQRFWPDGKRLKDDNPEYNTSNFMRGISVTRDIEYANKWNDVIFVFDPNKIKTKYKVIPYNWGYSIGKGYIQGSKMKREREEFIITGYNYPKYSDDDNKNNKKFIKMTSKPEGYIEPLNKYLLGFFISERFEKYINEDYKKYLQSHEKYLGYYEDDSIKKISMTNKVIKNISNYIKNI